MKNFDEFLEAIATDTELSKKVGSAKDVKEMVILIQNEGYAVSEDDISDLIMESVSGGSFLENLKGTLKEESKKMVGKALQAGSKEAANFVNKW